MPKTSSITANSSLASLEAHLAGLETQLAAAQNHPDSFFPNVDESTRAINWHNLNQRVLVARAWVEAKQKALARADSTRPNNLAAHNEKRATARVPLIELNTMRQRMLVHIDEARRQAQRWQTDHEILTDPTWANKLHAALVMELHDSITRLNQHVERNIMVMVGEDAPHEEAPNEDSPHEGIHDADESAGYVGARAPYAFHTQETHE